MLVLALFGRLSWGLKLAPFGLSLSIIIQYATTLSFSASVVGVLHPVNALVVFGVGAVTTHRAWRVLRK